MENSLFKVALFKVDIIYKPIDKVCSFTESQQVDRKGYHIKSSKGNVYPQNIIAHDNAVLMLQKIYQLQRN